MSNIQKGKEFTTVEEALLAGLNNLPISGANETIAKTSSVTFENREPSTSFINLSDTPDSYVGQGSKVVSVNPAENALIFTTNLSTDEKVKYDAGDPTAGYVADKIIAGTGISVAEGTGGNENKLVVTSTITQYTDEMAQDAVGNAVGNGLDYDDNTGAISVDETELSLPFLKLDQSTPQTVSGGMPVFAGGISYDNADWTGGNVIYIPLTKVGKTQTEILNEAIASATAGDTLVLGSGTYTTTDTITVNKSIFIKGQGILATTVTSNVPYDTFTISASGVRISDMTVTNTGSVTSGVYVTNNLTNITLRNLYITASGSGFKYGIYIEGSNVTILDTINIVSSANDSCYGVYIQNDSSTTQNSTVTIINTISVTTNTTHESEALYVYNNNDANTITVTLLNCSCTATSAAGTSDCGLHVNSTTTNTITVNANETTFNGGDYDVKVVNPNTVNLSGCTLYNGTISEVTGGIINKLGTSAVEKVKFDTTPTVGAFDAGKLYYDENWQTLSLNAGRDLTLQIGEEEWRRVYNDTGSTIANGKAVYTNGVYNAGTPYVATVALADASDSAKWQVLGLTTQEIETGHYGMVTVRGHVNDCNTNAWTAGDTLYLSDITPGEVTNTLPSAGNFKVRVGRVIYKDASVGVINVRLLAQGKLGDLSDVVAPTPSLDEVLTWNGTDWVNGAPATSSASTGIDFFNSTPVITSRTAPAGLNSAGTAGNGIQINSLSKTPVTTAEQTQTILANADTRAGAAWLYDTALGRTNIDAGIWDFATYASVSSTVGLNTITRTIYQVVPGTGTLTFTGANANDRVATITDAQYDGTYFAASATNTNASFIQATSGTDKGIYQISAMADGAKKIATVIVRTGYTNETGVTYNIWNKLFSVTTVDLTSTSLTQYDTTTSQPAFTIAVTDKLGGITFATTDAANRTFTIAYNGTARNTHVSTPLITLHNNLAGLQGGSASERYHISAAQATVVGNTSGTNTGDNSVNTSSANTALGNLASVAINTTLVSDTDNTDALGTTAIAWSDLFLGSGAVVQFNSAPSTSDVTLTHSANTLTLAGGDLLMATSLGATGTRVLKGWFTDLECTNAIAGSVTGNAGTVTNATLTTALTVNTGTVTLTGNAANNSVLTIGAGAVSVSGSNTGDGTYGIANTNYVKIDDAGVADNEYAKFTANGLEGRAYADVLSDIGAAATAQTFYIGTTQVAINRASAALTLAGITLTTPDIGAATGTSLSLSATSSLSLGTGSSLAGQIVFKNATNNNTATIQSGVTSTSYTLTLPTAVAAVTGYILSSTDAGVLSWVAAGAVEGTAVLSTGEAGGTKYLREDGDGTCSWQTVTATDTTKATKALDNLASVAINTTLVSDTYNTDALGTSAIAWSDLFLGNGAVIEWSSAASTSDVTLTHSANALTIAGGDLIMATSLGATGTRVLKGWFTDLEVTNAIAGSVTGNAGTVTNATLTTALTVNTGTVTLTGNVANNSVLTIGAGAVSVSGANTGDNAANSSTMYIGTTGVALNRASAALTLAGITLTTPDIGTPSAGVLTNCTGLTGDHNLTAGKQINLTLPTSDATCTGHVTSSFASGYTAAAGDLVFYGSGGKWLEVDSDAVATCNGLLGIAMEAKNNTEAMKVALPNSMVHFDAWTWTTGDTLYAGETLGAIQNTIPTGPDAIIKVIGFAIDADTIYFNPSQDQQSTVA